VITDRLYEGASLHPDKVFLFYGERQFTYRSTADMVSILAASLHARGVRRGERVALLCGNRPGFLICWFAINELGAICVPLNTGLVGDGLRYTLTQSEASVLLIEPELLEAKCRDVDTLTSQLAIIPITDSMECDPIRTVARWTAGERAALDSPNSILYTSGTTGLPKGVVLPHAAYVAAGEDMVHSLALTSDDRIMVFLPLFHANPQMYAVVSVLHVGAAMVLLPKFSASRFFEDAQRYAATGFTYVGTVLSILEKQNPTACRNHSLAWCVGGGAPERVWREIEDRFGISVRELYGMTETGGWATMNRTGATRFGSVGRPRESVEVSIRDEQGNPLGAKQKGEVVVRAQPSDKFFTGYWNNPDATASTLKNGWLYTGDRGWMDSDGYVYFDGRIKELIRRGGEMIAPTEIEQQLLKHNLVRDCVVVGVADDIMGEEIKALIVTSGPVDALQLREFLSDRLPAYMVPRYVGFVESIPKTETQKIKRHELAGVQANIVDLAER
jgi:acyl-CoA synthetase (AMP-forming)/AMP-acid ligase II